MRSRFAICLSLTSLFLLDTTNVRAADFSAQDQAALSHTLRGLILDFLPNPLLEETKHWGGQKEVANGVTWKRKKIFLKPQVQKKMKNHGQWWKVRVEALQPKQTLVVQLHNMHRPKKDHLVFDAYVAMNTRAHYDRQHWRAGVRTYSGSVRARMVVRLMLRCEAVTHVENTGKLLPDVVFRLRVTHANLTYDNLKVEHVPGLGGEVAEFIGRAFHETINQWRPSLRQNMLQKANAAIVKAGDTKEVKLSLSKLLGN